MLLARKLFDVSARSKVGSPTDRIENLGKFVEYLHAAVADIAAAK